MDRPPIMDRLFQGIQNEAGMRCPAYPPAHQIAGVNIDHESDVDEPSTGRHVGEVRDPQHVRHWRVELSVDLVERARRRLVADGCAHRLAADYALEAGIAHEPFYRASGDAKAFAVHLSPDLTYAVDAEVFGEHAQNLGLQRLVPLGAGRHPRRISPLRDVLVVGGWGDRQNPALRLDPVRIPMLIDEGRHRFSGWSSSAWAKYADALRRISLAW